MEYMMSKIELKTELGSQAPAIEAALAKMEAENIVTRIWEHDHTVWKPEPTEITNRLGWLTIAERMMAEIQRMEALRNTFVGEGFSQVLLLGMGGSSLAPEVFRKTFRIGEKGLALDVLDSTDPGAVLAYAHRLELSKTLFLVSTKSGGTVETLSFFKFFYNQVMEQISKSEAGNHFVAITDQGSRLETLAKELHFREVFINDPNIGGRFSVLSFFGMLPATLVGLDVAQLLKRATAMAAACGSDVALGKNPGALTGLLMGEQTKAGRDKITFVASPEIASFGDWVEQLIAESTGKEGVGILPVVGEPLGSPEVYGKDRVFVYLKLDGDTSQDTAINTLQAAGHPVLVLQLKDKYDLGGQFFMWEFATAVASYILQINPFDQPNVESAKVLARKMVAEYQEKGKLPPIESAPVTAEALRDFLKQVETGDYISLQAFITPSPEAESALQALRLWLRDTYKTATTLGFGPRFLHSTGQLHKGDGGSGLFIQFTSDAVEDADIPDEAGTSKSSISFNTLKLAQALGDGEALKAENRRFIRFHLPDLDSLEHLYVSSLER
jgi:transaldolase/glucose-6-phosphate isomerase